MASKLLQTFGALALLLLVVGSFAALAVVGSRVHVTLAEEDPTPRRGPDPIELLRADAGEMRAELSALASAFPEQLQVLHDALEEGASAREAELAAQVDSLRAQLSALQTRAEQDAAAAQATGAALETSLAQVRQGLRDVAEANPTAAAALSAAPLGEPTLEPAPELAPARAMALTTPPVEIPPPPAGSEAEPARKTALAFKVPAQAFRFEGRQRLALVPSLSRVGFDAKSTLHDFSGVTQRVEGELAVDLSKPARKPSGWIEVEAATLDTGLADRDEAMRKLLDTQAHPKLRFEWTGMEAVQVDAAGLSVRGTATGNLSLAGKSRAVSMPVTVQVDASKRVSIEGSLPILLSDYGLLPPSKLGLISVEDRLELWIALRARTLGPIGGTQ